MEQPITCCRCNQTPPTDHIVRAINRLQDEPEDFCRSCYENLFGMVDRPGWLVRPDGWSREEDARWAGRPNAAAWCAPPFPMRKAPARATSAFPAAAPIATDDDTPHEDAND